MDDQPKDGVSDRLRQAEQVLYGVDQQLLTGGLRLTLVLPAFALFLAFIAWSVATSTEVPAWWTDGIEPTLGVSLGWTLVAIQFTMVLTFALMLVVHRVRLGLSVHGIESEVAELGGQHRWVASSHGYDHIEEVMHRSVRATTSAIVLLILCLTLLLIELARGPSDPAGQIAHLAASSFLLLAFGEHLSRSGRLFTSSSETGLLEAYDPPIHPSTLHAVFEEILLTVMDPLLRAKYERFMNTLIEHRKPDVDALPAKEKLLALQWMRCDGQILTPALAKEIEEVLDEEGVQFLRGHKVFTPDVWTQLFDKATEVAPAFFRLMRRTTERIRMGNLRGRQDLLVDVDMANIVDGSTGLFMYIRNLDATPRTVVLRMQSPDFRPNDLALTFHLPAGEAESLLGSALPVSGEGDHDVIGSLVRLLQLGTTSWQSLIPNRFGEATVTVRLENEDGDLLLGQQINTRDKEASAPLRRGRERHPRRPRRGGLGHPAGQPFALVVSRLPHRSLEMEHGEAQPCAETGTSAKSDRMLTCVSVCMRWKPRCGSCEKFATSTATRLAVQGTSETRSRPSTRSTVKRWTCSSPRSRPSAPR